MQKPTRLAQVLEFEEQQCLLYLEFQGEWEERSQALEPDRSGCQAPMPESMACAVRVLPEGRRGRRLT